MLVLVRHGRTAANAARKLQGHIDLPLDEVGLEQVTEVAEWLGRPDRIISSPLVRARQTAEAFHMPYEVDDRWIELDYGDLDGVPVDEVDAEVWARWRVDPMYRVGGGESLHAMGERAVAAAQELMEEARNSTVVVTTHVSPIKAVVSWALGVDLTVGWRCHLDQASVCRILFGPQGPVLFGFNETRRDQTSWRP
ncbi:MAG: ribonuclease / adenosylcobalamin/alpha-ribazole phosphatase [Ilumatobacteraceae bacterium]